MVHPRPASPQGPPRRSTSTSALSLGGGVGCAGGGSGGCAVGELAPVGAFVVGSGVAGGEDGCGGGVDAGGEQSLVLGPGGAVGGWAGRRPRGGGATDLGGHWGARAARQAGAGRGPGAGGGRGA